MNHHTTELANVAVQRLRLFLFAAGLLLLIGPLRAKLDATANPTEGREEASAKLQRVIDSLRERLEISSPVSATVVPENSLAFSVTPAERGGGFIISVESAYLELLTDDELEAALAHELGHVWIFTHHPYLQTEQLANRVAMRATQRDSLAKVYEKLWKRIGAKGDLVQFLGK